MEEIVLIIRELEVLQKLWREPDRQKAADNLYLKLPTLRAFLRTAYLKLGVNKLSAAHRILAENNLLGMN